MGSEHVAPCKSGVDDILAGKHSHMLPPITRKHDVCICERTYDGNLGTDVLYDLLRS